MGRIMARALLDNGARIAAVDRNPDGLADFTKEAAAMGAGDRLTTFAIDVRFPLPVAQVAAKTVERFGAVHALINNAGLGPQHVVPAFAERKVKFWEAEPDKWQALMDVNVRGAFLAARAVVPYMLKQHWGRIVNVTTSFDTMLEEGFSPYGPSKAALEAQSAIWAKDLKDTGVTVNILVPGGAADTPFVPDRANFDRAKLVRPEVMAAPIVWLISDDSDGITNSRFVGRLWNTNLPPSEAAAKVRAPIGWPGYGVQSASREAAR
jgi:NAD(P)-dependent dehydrogenase (short-subunit alcohol dehydrogenase family)